MTKKYDFNLLVIGAGAAGLMGAYAAAAAQARVLLIEQDNMGGDCLNAGCVPSKALLHVAKEMRLLHRAQERGMAKVTLPLDFAQVMQRVKAVKAAIAPHDSADRYRKLGVEVALGAARIIDPHQVEVQGQRYSSRALLIATGAKPILPRLPGLELVPHSTSATIWNLEALPPRLLVLGGGPMGCELALAFASLGSQVKLVNLGARVLEREDPFATKIIEQRLAQAGVELFNQHRATEFGLAPQGPCLWAQGPLGVSQIYFDHALIAVGRQADVGMAGLQELGIRLRPNGTIETDAYLRTNIPSVFAAGDVTGPIQLTHAAGHQGWHAAANALLAPLRGLRADRALVPRCTFVEPELAQAGLTEPEAQTQGIAYERHHFPLSELDRALIEEEGQGFVKLLTAPGSDRILGVTILGPQAGELLAPFLVAMNRGSGLKALLQVMHPYPTLAEANQRVAGLWRAKRVSPWLLQGLAKFHAWRRGA